MAYTVEVKRGSRIYLYRVESYWDKTKKQSRQKRVYLGPKGALKKPKKNKIGTNFACKAYGNIFLLENLAKKLNLKKILEAVFPSVKNEILALAYHQVMEGEAFYLFPGWLEAQALEEVKKVYSSDISQLCELLGKLEKERIEFNRQWIENLGSVHGIYYDITSISSYSSKINFVEWGYNRDKENLPQVNMGVSFCQKRLLPVHYHLYPGSIVDVSTLKNCIKYLRDYNLKKILMILDRGFCSKKNILEMEENGLKFIQPLSYSLKKVKNLLKKHKKNLKKPGYAFKYKEEILGHVKSKIEFDDKEFEVHIFFNEKAEVEQRHRFLKDLLEIESKICDKQFENLKESMQYKKDMITERYRKYFKYNQRTKQIEQNSRAVNRYISNQGSFILATNTEINRTQILDYYRQRDGVEKIFDISKNEIDTQRLRSHSIENVNGRLFIKFIALILYSEILKIMRAKELFKKYSLKELLRELAKLKLVTLKKEKPFFTELSKKQKAILDAFQLQYNHFSS